MNKTILITGASSGIGKETALYFSKRHWNVIATSRSREKLEQTFKDCPDIFVHHLDVQNTKSINDAIISINEKYPTIDVLVNNAGFAVTGLFEYSTSDQIRNEFNTNVFGLMDVTRKILPIMRKQGFGTIINISSIGGIIGFPLYSMYQASKFAIEGFSESLAYELEPLNIKIKIVEPGLIQTKFYSNSMDFIEMDNIAEEYKTFIQKVETANTRNMKNISKPIVIAKCIYTAATDNSKKLRYHAGRNSNLLVFMRKVLPFKFFSRILKSSTM